VATRVKSIIGALGFIGTYLLVTGVVGLIPSLHEPTKDLASLLYGIFIGNLPMALASILVIMGVILLLIAIAMARLFNVHE